MIRRIEAAGGVAGYCDEIVSEYYNHGNPALELNIGDSKRKRISYKEAEYELALRKLHGQYAQVSEEDWKELKRISDKYGY